ncbi:hypothetical protein SAMN02745691_00888 [Parasporobacterium paucivorans DSM 15970]|uniref:Uncharacterized protein n=2 Tax=Parasporobacterium TaxID=115543 RepID=A0A1M6E8C9_9FIRM|nr:hypothetical protein SAMN02745691_00888 [Parasporobacterium paucivorans DSM 15970]
MRRFKEYFILAVGVIAVIATYLFGCTYSIREFENESRTQQAAIGRVLMMSRNFIETLTIFGNDFLERGIVDGDAPIYDYLVFDEKTGSYTMDALRGTRFKDSMGNLTGLKSIPTAGNEKAELDMVLHYNKFFYEYYDRLPNLAWIYYTARADTSASIRGYPQRNSSIRTASCPQISTGWSRRRTTLPAGWYGRPYIWMRREKEG